MLRDLQQRFAEAMVDPAKPLPPELLTPTRGTGLERRFTVHRATYGKSLGQVIAAAFPGVAAILGPTRIEKAGIIFASKHPPTKAALWQYGAGFPAFLAEFKPLQSIPYLPDLARVDWAHHLAWFAEDQTPLDPSRLTEIPPELIATVSFVSHPAAAIVDSPYPVGSLRHALMNREEGNTEKISLPDGGETVLITRPQGNVSDTLIPRRDRHMTNGLLAGLPIGEAMDQAATQAARSGQIEPPDLQSTLSLLLTQGALQDIVGV